MTCQPSPGTSGDRRAATYHAPRTRPLWRRLQPRAVARGDVAGGRPPDAQGRRQPRLAWYLRLGAPGARRGRASSSIGSTASSTCSRRRVSPSTWPRRQPRRPPGWCAATPRCCPRPSTVSPSGTARDGTTVRTAWPIANMPRASSRPRAALRGPPVGGHVAHRQRVRVPHRRVLLRRIRGGVPGVAGGALQHHRGP